MQSPCRRIQLKAGEVCAVPKDLPRAISQLEGGLRDPRRRYFAPPGLWKCETARIQKGSSARRSEPTPSFAEHSRGRGRILERGH